MQVSPPATQFRLRSLGPAVLVDGEDDRIVFETRKHLLLVFYLARQPGRPVSRDELTDLFWHGDDERKARHSLSHAVSLTNKALGMEAIVPAKAGRVMLREGVVSLDLREFEQLVGEGQFLQARELWNGRLFEGYWVPRAPKLEEWLDSERARVERVFRRVLHELIEEFRASGDYDLMRKEAEVLLELDDLDERAMTALLESLTLSGDRTLALRRFKDFERKLSQELGAEPSPNLIAWAKRSRQAPTTTVLSTRVAEAPVLPGPKAVFGRDTEFEELWQKWDAAKSGRGAFVIVEGAAGIGKTALAIKLANQVQVTGGAVCFVKCYRTDRAVPFAPIASMAKQLAQMPGFLAMGSTWIGELTRLYPELRERFPNAPQPLAIDDSARHRICDATIEACRSVAFEQPLLVLVDDATEADEASLALLHYLGREIRDSAILLLCTSRLESIRPDAERVFLDIARSAKLASFIELKALPRNQISRIVTQILAARSADLEEDKWRAIIDSAKGNPLLAIEATLNSLQVSAEEESQAVSKNPRMEFESSVVQRLSQLSSDANLIVGALIIAGRPLTEFELVVATNLGAAELAAGLSELDSARFTRRDGGLIHLAHDRYADGVSSLLTDDVRQKLHSALARYLHATVAANPSMSFELAVHLKGAGRVRAARRQAQAAQEYASSVGAIRSKAQAIELELSLTATEDPRTLIDLGRCYLTLNDLDSLKNLCNRGRAKSSIRPDIEYFAVAIGLQDGSLTLEVARDRLLHLLDQEGLFATRAEALLLLLRVADKTFSYPIVKNCARQLRRSHPTAFGCFATAYLYSKYYWAEPALRAIESALEVAHQERNWTVEQLCRDGLGIALKQVGRYRDSIKQFNYSLGLARKTMNPHAEIACLHNRAVTELCLGHFEAMRTSHAEARRIGVGYNAFSRYHVYNEAVADLIAGKYADSLAGFEASYSSAVRESYPIMASQSAGGIALVHERLGNEKQLAAAVEILRRALPEKDRMTLTWVETAALAHDDVVHHRCDSAEVVARVEQQCRMLARRDRSYWLALRYESIRLRERIERHTLNEERADLVRVAQLFEADGTRKQATNLL